VTWLRAGAATDIGLVRSTNQDHLLVADPLFAVADGMGGAAAGEVASETAVTALEEAFARADAPTADALVDAARVANRAVWDKAEAHPQMRGMGTTLVALALVEGGRLAAINIGDSRMYALGDGELRQVTSDHNMVAELVAMGRITPEQAEVHPRRNVVTRALGVDPDVAVDLFVEDARPGDRYLLCSDGLPREVSDDFIASLLRRLADPGEAARALVDEARRRGGNDNITVVVVDVVSGEQADLGTESTIVLPVPVGAGEGHTTDTVPAGGEAAGAEVAGAEVAFGGDGRAPRRRFRLRRAREVSGRPKARFLTFRVVAFILAFILVLAAGAAAIAWYARAGYFVGVEGRQLVIYQGRPGGVLWFSPTVSERTGRDTSEVLPVHVPALESGVQEASLDSARRYVQRLLDEKAQAVEQSSPPLSVPATTAPTTTTSRATTHPAQTVTGHPTATTKATATPASAHGASATASAAGHGPGPVGTPS